MPQPFLALSVASPTATNKGQPDAEARPSVHLLHLADDLLLEDRQDGFVFPNLLKHHSTVKLVTHFLKVVSGGHR